MRFLVIVTAVLLLGAEPPHVVRVGKDAYRQWQPPPDIDVKRTGGSRPLSPLQSLAKLKARPGLEVELMAAEPLVADPVALAFGPDGRLWVAEMADYPSGRTGNFDPGGRVVILEDRDGDGLLDRRSVFLEGLPFPTGVLPWRNGVLICAAPDILYAEDTRRDGKADIVKKLYSGFGTHNYQARVNSLQYGLDGWVYGSCGLFGGTILCHKTGQEVTLGDRDFRIKPDSGELEAATGRTQQGRVRDDWDNWFGCENRALLRHYPLADHYLRRNPHVAASVSTIGLDPSHRLFPLRVDAQRFKLSGPPASVTAACGLGIYRDDLLGSDYSGNAFTCEPVNLLVHRLKLTPSGATFTAARAEDEQTSEFLASTDTWFRPVHAVSGPDGGLWVADMYRFIIEHPRWIPAEELTNLDPRAGSGLGRLYRVKAKDRPLRTWPRLDQLDSAKLVAALDSPSGWQRDMATQLLLWRNDRSCRAALEQLAATSARSASRLHALVIVDGLGLLDSELVRSALHDPHPGVRRQVFRIAEPFLNQSAMVGEGLLGCVPDVDAKVQVQLACTLGGWRDPRAARELAALVRAHAADPIVAAAVMSSLTADNIGIVADAVLRLPEPPGPVVRDLLATAAAGEGAGTLARLLTVVAQPRSGRFLPWQLAAAAGAIEALERRGRSWPQFPADVRTALTPLVAFARRVVEAGEPETLQALPLLAREPATQREDVKRLVGLLAATRPAAVQNAAVTALLHTGAADVPPALVSAWPGASPALRAKLLDALLSRPAWHAELFKAAETGVIAPGQINASQRQRLLTHPDLALRRQAEKAFAGAINADRAKVIAAFEPALSLAGDRARGKKTFGRACAACHRLDSVGSEVGPDLASITNKTPRYLLTEILDPNRNLDSRYLEYQAELKDGRILAGVLAAETATGITLRGQQGKDETILRADLEQLRGTARSLMPEGLEKDLTQQDMADLLAYLGGRGDEGVNISPAKSDGNGFLIHEVHSRYQAGTTQIRVLLPDKLEPDKRYPVVFILPVEAGRESRYGDGLLEIKKRGLHNELQAIFVAPTFSHLPWYADHPTKPDVRQETYFLEVVLPFIEKAYPIQTAANGRLLLGFSKSGWGAFSLLLRHPHTFAKAAAWDAPLLLDRPGRYGSADIFATQENFESYRITKLLAEHAKLLQQESRLILLGYGNFRADHEQAHRLMTELKIAHDYHDGPPRPHDWHSGWVAEAARLLLEETHRE